MKSNQNTTNAIIGLVASYVLGSSSNIDKKIAQLTLENVSKIPQLTVEEVAELCGVSVSSYIRFCKHIGYASYTQFKIHIEAALQKYFYIGATPIREDFSSGSFFEFHKQALENDYQVFRQCMDLSICERIVEALANSKRIYIIDLFYSTIRFRLLGDLSVYGKHVSEFAPWEDGFVQMIKELDENCCILYFNDGTSRTAGFGQHLQECKKAGARVCAISNVSQFVNSSSCDDILYIGQATSSISSITLHDLALQFLSTLLREKYLT